jgi:hypothetical protein
MAVLKVLFDDMLFFVAQRCHFVSRSINRMPDSGHIQTPGIKRNAQKGAFVSEKIIIPRGFG